jgi:Galactose oxidase, central domain/Kelch motif
MTGDRGSVPRTELRKRMAASTRPRILGGPWGATLIIFALAWAALLGLVGRSWPVVPLAAVLLVSSILVVLARVPDWWQLPWLKLWQWVAVGSRKRSLEALGADAPTRLTSAWLDMRPPETVPDSIRVGVLIGEGAFAEARALAERMASATPIERLRRATCVANVDLSEGLPADYSDARREVPNLEGEQLARAIDSLTYNESLAAIAAGRSLRELTPPDTRHMRFGARFQMRLMTWRLFPLPVFIGVFACTYLLLSIVGSAMQIWPRSDTFSPTGTMTVARMNPTATLLRDGRVLIVGGSDGTNDLGSAELYDPKTGTFRPTGPMNIGRATPTATLLGDGMVLIAGGDEVATDASTAELYDPSTGSFGRTGSMTTFAYDQTATLLADGRVLIAGGLAFGPEASAELYDPATGTFASTGSMEDARVGHTATLLPDGQVLIAGGEDAGGPLVSAELFDPKSGTFAPTGSMPIRRTSAAATRLTDGRVLIVGGTDGSDPLASAELYDPRTGRFTATGSMAEGRFAMTATLLTDGTVLVAGGSGDATAELYDPSTGAFRQVGSMVAVRLYHTATLLSDGRVLIAGGQTYSYNGAVASAELFTP